MSDFLTLWSGTLDTLVDFLLTEPISGFVGVILLAYVASLVHRLFFSRA